MTPADLLELRRALAEVLGLDQPGGQLRDERAVLWLATDEADWNAGGAGDPQPDLDDPGTWGACLAYLGPRFVDMVALDDVGTMAVRVLTPRGIRTVTGPMGVALARACVEVGRG